MVCRRRGQWIEFCFDKDSIPVAGIKIAFYNGNTRQTYFDILLSKDGENYFPLKTNLASSGNSLELEEYKFDEVVWTKKIRILGHGNSANAWNSYTEVKIDTSSIPFTSRHIIPGKIECEEYDLGGEGISFHDTTEGNSGDAFRNDDVDIEECSEGGYNIGWTDAGEWLLYSVEVQAEAYYNVSIRTAALGDGGAVELFLDKESIAVFDLPQTNDWQNYTTSTVQNVYLPAGKHTLLLKINEGGSNLNYINIENNGTVSLKENIVNKQLSIHPNPTSGIFEISMSSMKETQAYDVEVYDIKGLLLLTYKEMKNAKESFDISSLQAGVYLLKIKKEDEIISTKIILLN